MNEDKVKEALEIIDAMGSLVGGQIGKARDILKEALQPEQEACPPIPEGVPVKMWNEDRGEFHKSAGFYMEEMREDYLNIEIDYQRKGHVIPWNGGECPVDGYGSGLAYYRNGGYAWFGDGSTLKGWKHCGNNLDIIAYVIWPEWTDKLSEE